MKNLLNLRKAIDALKDRNKQKDTTMAQVDKLIPIIIKWEAGTVAEGLSNEELFEKARPKGFGNDPADTGGATMVGITLDTFKAYRKKNGKKPPTVTDLKNIKYDEWRDILKTMFWDKMRADEIRNQSIANLCVNSVWGSGAGYIKTIQQVVGVAADGIVGPITLKAINENPHPDWLFRRLWERRAKFFEDIVARSVADYEKKLGRPATEREKMQHTKKRFLNGWMNRLNDFRYEP